MIRPSYLFKHQLKGKKISVSTITSWSSFCHNINCSHDLTFGTETSKNNSEKPNSICSEMDEDNQNVCFFNKYGFCNFKLTRRKKYYMDYML